MSFSRIRLIRFDRLCMIYFLLSEHLAEFSIPSYLHQYRTSEEVVEVRAERGRQ